MLFSLLQGKVGNRKEAHFPFQHDNAQFIVEELDWPAQHPDLNNPIQHVEDEVECQLRARSDHLTSVWDLTDVLVSERE